MCSVFDVLPAMNGGDSRAAMPLTGCFLLPASCFNAHCCNRLRAYAGSTGV